MKQKKQQNQSKTVMVLVPNDDIASKLSAWIEAWFLIQKYQQNLQIPWLMRTDNEDLWSEKLTQK